MIDEERVVAAYGFLLFVIVMLALGLYVMFRCGEQSAVDKMATGKYQVVTNNVSTYGLKEVK